MIGQAARDQRPDFDGHYIVTFWGCGTNCAAGAIIDAVGGGVTMLPVVSDYFTGADDDGPDFTFRLDSRLFIINGMIRDKPPRGLHYFAFDGRRLKHLLTMEKPAPKAAESR